MQNYFREILEEHQNVFLNIDKIFPDLEKIVNQLYYIVKNKNKIMFCGNGGSAADSQHLAAEFVGRFEIERKALAAISLTTDSSILTSVGNDYNFDEIFSRQVSGLGNKGDALVCISTSGNSVNLKNAVLAAKQMKIITIGLLGNNGGIINDILDYSIIVDSSKTARIQEAHIFIGHTICALIDKFITMEN